VFILPHRCILHQVLPYWGNLADRKTLRRLLAPSRLYGRAAPFHVALTSYQIAVADEAVLKKVKWQFMILDEAQVRVLDVLRCYVFFALSCVFHNKISSSSSSSSQALAAGR
jgi:DNA helicase INO80